MSAPARNLPEGSTSPDLTQERHLRSISAGRCGVRVLVVSDHELVQWGLRSLLGRQEWVGRCLPARSAADAVELARRYEPHVALVDVFFAGGTGLDLCERLHDARPQVRLLLMSTGGAISPETAKVVRAKGVIPKDWSLPQIVRAVELVANGISLEPQPDSAGLSGREREVLGLVATGATNAQIAEILFLSPHTVKDHISSIFRKLGVRNRAEAVQRGHQLGLTAAAPQQLRRRAAGE